ncbi:hypothetical protein [Novispirillum itersonii]|uniref:hypothetical protein n=1 Tax=Novispirillum itersonii TaxID=189 RepID=UPI0003611CC8|nr:hypothetical protein [Novispirillum itersonii]
MPLLIVLTVGALALAMPLTISLSVVLVALAPSHALLSVGLPALVLSSLLGLHHYYQTHYRDGIRQTCGDPG